jgi:hypothetical protein
LVDGHDKLGYFTAARGGPGDLMADRIAEIRTQKDQGETSLLGKPQQ